MGLEVADTIAALDKMIARLPGGALDAARRMGDIGRGFIQMNLSRTFHAEGGPGSPPGTPPAYVSGELQRSVRQTEESGPGAVAWVDIAPTTVYARIQELGGISGAGHRTHLLPRPYVRPALDQGRAGFEQAAKEAFWRALEGALL